MQALREGQDQAETVTRFGLARARFGRHPQGKPVEEASLVVPATSVQEIRLPAALFRDREFVVDAKIDPDAADSIVQCQVLNTTPRPIQPSNGKAPLVGTPDSPAAKRLLQGFDDFRRCFPLFICHSAASSPTTRWSA